jgi:general L-amino acid transport system substrate-binding protein
MQITHATRTIGFLVVALILSACAGNAPATTENSAAPAASEAAAAPAESTAAIGQIGGAASAAPAESAPADASAPAASAAAGGQASPAATGSGAPAVAQAGQLLSAVRNRGQLVCGVNQQLPGFGSVNAAGEYEGFDVDFCKAIAAAVFGDPNAVQYRPLSAQERFTAVQTGEVDILIRNTTLTSSRDTSVGLDFGPVNFYDGQGIMVREAEGITDLAGLDGASICVQSGTTTELNLTDVFRAQGISFEPVVFEDADQTATAYDEGRCDAFTTDKSGLASYRLRLQNPDEHVILDATLSKEPLAPSVLQGDPQWADIMKWVTWGTFAAEEYGITSENVQEQLNNEDPNVRRLLGAEGDFGTALGLDNDFMVDVITAVGNYGEIYNRHLGPDTPVNIPRGQNALYTEGGLIYAPPVR